MAEGLETLPEQPENLTQRTNPDFEEDEFKDTRDALTDSLREEYRADGEELESTASAVSLLVAKSFLEPTDVWDAGIRKDEAEYQPRFHVTPKFWGKCNRVVSELQVIIDPEFKGLTVPNSLVSTTADILAPLREGFDTDSRLRHIYSRFPHHNEQLSGYEIDQLDRGTTWKGVGVVPKRLTNAFPDRQPEVTPWVVYYNSEGKRHVSVPRMLQTGAEENITHRDSSRRELPPDLRGPPPPTPSVAAEEVVNQVQQHAEGVAAETLNTSTYYADAEKSSAPAPEKSFMQGATTFKLNEEFLAPNPEVPIRAMDESILYNIGVSKPPTFLNTARPVRSSYPWNAHIPGRSERRGETRFLRRHRTRKNSLRDPLLQRGQGSIRKPGPSNPPQERTIPSPTQAPPPSQPGNAQGQFPPAPTPKDPGDQRDTGPGRGGGGGVGPGSFGGGGPGGYGGGNGPGGHPGGFPRYPNPNPGHGGGGNGGGNGGNGGNGLANSMVPMIKAEIKPEMLPDILVEPATEKKDHQSTFGISP
ncbi:hypothetical protein C8R46DRAFT_1046239 [Mycena filopes]|nr:hypothetical protein C8R46DRAFT_1046239 [Mycena filopes]